MRTSPLWFLGLVVLVPLTALALETKTATVGKCHVVTETEGPYVEAGDQGFALPSIETAVAVTPKAFETLRRFLTRHCARTPGCELTYETETRAVVAARAPSGASLAVPYTEKAKKTFPGRPETVRTTLRGWSHDTYALVADTAAGNFCIPNDYAWKAYTDQARAVLGALGDQEVPLAKAVAVEVTAYPLAGATVQDCRGFLGGIVAIP